MNDMEARAYEAVSHDIWQEYNRKSRISAGNFQNLWQFRHLLWSRPFSIAFAFMSHKVLRWLGPFFILLSWLCLGILALTDHFPFTLFFFLQTALMFLVPLLEYFFTRIGINFVWLRNISYFFIMNLALLEGFFKYLKGIKNNVWQPPIRN